MRLSEWLGPIGAVLLVATGVVACGDDTSSDDDDGGTTGDTGTGTGTDTGTGTNPMAIDIIVDTNRDGLLDPVADAEGEDTWDAAHGAMFLSNLDDDDGDGNRDADDTFLNGGEDYLDLIAFQIAPCPGCAADQIGKLEIDPASIGKIRIFKLDPATGGWNLAAGELAACTASDPNCIPQAYTDLYGPELNAGVTFGIEARDFIRDVNSWGGYVDLSLHIIDATGATIATPENPDGYDRVRLRVAPWQLNGNLHPFDNVWSSPSSAVFVAGVTQASEAAGVEYTKHPNYSDQWTQDWMQSGYYVIPRADAQGQPIIHGMRVMNPRPWTQGGGPPLNWLMNNYLGPDQAVIQVYNVYNTGDSFDSHGNHDLIPVSQDNPGAYPMGRIIHGSGVIPETKTFYASQRVQAPTYVAFTDWLCVGHVDEFLSYIPATTPRGWKLVVADADMSHAMFLDLQAQGEGSAIVHAGKYWQGSAGSMNAIPAAISIDELLADQDIMEASQDAQAYIDEERDALVAELGMSDAEVIYFPTLFEVVTGCGGRLVAYQPGTVNSLVMGNVIGVPKPFGPNINGEDPWEVDIEQKLGPGQDVGSDGGGMEVVFIDDWDTYHRLLGEVHCGTNPETSAPFSSVNWWENAQP